MTIQRKGLSCTTIGTYVGQDKDLRILRSGDIQSLYKQGFWRSAITDEELSCTTFGIYVGQDKRDYAA